VRTPYCSRSSVLRCAESIFLFTCEGAFACAFLCTLALLLAILFFRQGAVFIREQFIPDQKILPEIISFVIIFFIVFAVIKIIEMALKNIIEGIRLGGFDRLMGFLFGCAQGIVIVCLVIFVISVQPFIDPAIVLGKSFCAEILLPLIMGDKKEPLEMIIQRGTKPDLLQAVRPGGGFRLDTPGEIFNGV